MLFDKPLYDFVRKKKRSAGTILTFKLKVLGEHESDAKPWIVVLCDKLLFREAQNFFKQTWVKKECHLEPNDSRPSFNVFIYDRSVIPLKYPSVRIGTRAATKDTQHTTRINLNGDQALGCATLGGVVHVTMFDGICYVYGMTAGHIIQEESIAELTDDADQAELLSDSHVDYYEDESGTKEEEDGEDGLSDCDSPMFVLEDFSDCGSETDFEDIVSQEDSSVSGVREEATVGYIHEVSYDLDWALISMQDCLDRVERPKASDKASMGNPSTTFPCKAYITNGHGECLPGVLTTASFCYLPFGTKLTEVYEFVLDNPGGSNAIRLYSRTNHFRNTSPSTR